MSPQRGQARATTYRRLWPSCSKPRRIIPISMRCSLMPKARQTIVPTRRTPSSSSRRDINTAFERRYQQLRHVIRPHNPPCSRTSIRLAALTWTTEPRLNRSDILSQRWPCGQPSKRLDRRPSHLLITLLGARASQSQHNRLATLPRHSAPPVPQPGTTENKAGAGR